MHIYRSILTIRSAKELEHFERIRQSFDSVDEMKKDPSPTAPQTIAEAVDALRIKANPTVDERPRPAGEVPHPGSVHGYFQGLKKESGYIVASNDESSTSSSRRKGKSVVSKNGKVAIQSMSNPSRDSDEEEAADYQLDANGVDEFIVRTGHLPDPLDEVE